MGILTGLLIFISVLAGIAVIILLIRGLVMFHFYWHEEEDENNFTRVNFKEWKNIYDLHHDQMRWEYNACTIHEIYQWRVSMKVPNQHGAFYRTTFILNIKNPIDYFRAKWYAHRYNSRERHTNSEANLVQIYAATLEKAHADASKADVKLQEAMQNAAKVVEQITKNKGES